MSTLAAWRTVLAQRNADLALADAMRVRRNRRLLSGCLRALQDAASLKQDAERHASLMLERRSQRLQGQVFLGWLVNSCMSPLYDPRQCVVFPFPLPTQPESHVFLADSWCELSKESTAQTFAAM
jgi:hypothetical protein